MQPLRTRLICRAHNRFTPSIAWWQPPKLRLISSTAEAGHSGETRHGGVPIPSGPGKPEPVPVTTKEMEHGSKQKEFEIRRMTTVKGTRPMKKPRAREDSKPDPFKNAEELLSAARAAFDQAMDYEGVVVKPVVNSQPVKESQLPWCLLPADRNIPGIERLATEIRHFGEYVVPGRYESIARRHVIEQVRDHVREALPKHALEVFGSERTGIALATSDIDFRLVRSSQIADAASNKLPPSPDERSQALAHLHLLKGQKFERHRSYLLPAVRYARYPLISMQDRQSGLDIQIVSSNDTSISRELMSGYMEECPYLQQLYFVAKTIFDVRGLSDVFRGGFGSYSLFMMVVASIRHNPHPRNDAAGGLINFLQFWRDFDTEKLGVSIEPISLFDKASQPVVSDTIKSKIEKGTLKPLPTYMLCLRDPADETNDLGRKGVAIKHVQATFRSLSEQLVSDMRVNKRPSLLGPLVGTCYMLNRARRANLEFYGRRIANRIKLSLKAKAMAMQIAEASEKEAKRDQAEKAEREKSAQEELAEEKKDEVEKYSIIEHGEALVGISGNTSTVRETDQEDYSTTEPPTSIPYAPPQVASDSRTT